MQAACAACAFSDGGSMRHRLTAFAIVLQDIVPCLLPESGGPVGSDVEVFDRTTGDVTLLVGPAVAHISQLDRR